MKTENVRKIIPGLVVVLAILIVLPNCGTTVQPNEVAVIKTMGKITKQLARGSGFSFKIPFMQTVTKLDMSPVNYEMHFSIGSDSAVTADMQSVGLDSTLVYRFTEDGIMNYVTNFTKDSLEKRFRSNTNTCVKDIIGKYSIYDLTSSTIEISAKVQENLTAKCADMPIEIVSVNISNWDWSQEFDRMIQDTMNATQKEKTAKANVAIAEAEAQKQVAEAKAKLEAEKLNAEAMKVKADAEAYEMRTKNAAIQATLATQRETWGHEEKMKYYEKWDGHLEGASASNFIVTPNYSGLNVTNK